jgi:hypothetical protein
LWENFIKEFAKYADEKVRLCIAAPPDQVFQTQGGARELVELSALFNEAIDRAKRLPQQPK